MGLLRRAEEYRESKDYVGNEEMQNLADGYARGPLPPGEPVTEEEMDKRVRERILRT